MFIGIFLPQYPLLDNNHLEWVSFADLCFSGPIQEQAAKQAAIAATEAARMAAFEAAATNSASAAELAAAAAAAVAKLKKACEAFKFDLWS